MWASPNQRTRLPNTPRSTRSPGVALPAETEIDLPLDMGPLLRRPKPLHEFFERGRMLGRENRTTSNGSPRSGPRWRRRAISHTHSSTIA
jgi:hypothetical protein